MNNFKYKLSQFYLDISGRLPKFLGQWVGHLQHIKSHQDKDAVDCLEKSQRPTNNDLRLEGLTIYEIYHLEDFSGLEKSLDSMYDASEHNITKLGSIKRKYKEFISRASKNIAAGGSAWTNLGYITPNKSSHLISSVRIKEIPWEVKHIQLCLLQLLPSVIVLYFYVTFSKKVNDDINNLIEQKCGAKIVLTSILPWRYGYRTTSASTEKEKKIYNYVKNLKLTTEGFLQTYFSGYYLSTGKKSDDVLCPNVEIFSVNKVLLNKNSKNSGNWFWNSLGFQWYFKDIIYKSKSLYFFNTTVFFSKKYSYKLLVKKNKLDLKFAGSMEGAISCEVSDFLVAYTPFIVLNELFLNIMASLGRLGSLIAKKITSNKTSFNQLLSSNTTVNREVFILNRINLEWQTFRQEKRAMWLAAHEEFEQIDDSINQKKQLLKLSMSLWKSIDYYSEIVVKQYNELRNNYENYLSAHNLINADKTQRRISRLTYVLVVGMVIQIVSSSESLKAYLLLIFYWVMKILKLGNFSH